MKKSALLNSELSYVIAKMGHTDTLTVGDCGLPIPQETQRIDLALRKGTPGFLETLDTILKELCVQEIILAEEMKDVSPELWHETLHRFPNIKVTYVSHEKLKELTKKSQSCCENRRNDILCQCDPGVRGHILKPELLLNYLLK